MGRTVQSRQGLELLTKAICWRGKNPLFSGMAQVRQRQPLQPFGPNRIGQGFI
jgi:hypothetical protein